MELEKSKKSKGTSILSFVIKAIIYILLIGILLIILVQKITDNKHAFMGIQIFRVISNSMKPEYNVNDILLVRQTNPEEIKVGNNITYLGKIDDEIYAPITHKVVQIEKTQENTLLFYTKGLANITEDPVVTEQQIYGVVVSKLHILSLINKLVNNVLGYILLIFIPLLVLIFKNIKELISMSKEKTDEK